MNEIKAILKAYDSLDHAQTKAALATVVRVEGSSYRRTGARMLVMDNGQWVGGISGGCLEGDALKRARLAIAKTAPSLITYDTTQDDAYQIGVGLGCNGIIDVLLAPILPHDPYNPIEVLKSVVTDRRQINLLLTLTRLDGTLTTLRAGHMIRYAGRPSLDILADDALIHTLEREVGAVIENRKSQTLVLPLPDGRQLEVFAEYFPPELHVLLMGHQYDVYPLAKLIREIGWRVTVVAPPQKIHREVARLAAAIVPPEDFSPELVDPFTAVILMAHDYKTDKRNLPLVIATQASYIGLLGPRVRAEKIFNELAEEGISISNEHMNRVFAPVGLDLGAISPEEIALSIVAEIRAVFSDRAGTSLRQRTVPIHER
jgi:xanthine dehydrogenase accessory factor